MIKRDIWYITHDKNGYSWSVCLSSNGQIKFLVKQAYDKFVIGDKIDFYEGRKLVGSCYYK